MPAGTYDMILMDIQMPKMNGYKATQAIRRLPDKEKACISIIAMTANAFEEDKRDALAVGMNGHIANPLSLITAVDVSGSNKATRKLLISCYTEWSVILENMQKAGRDAL